MRINIQQAFRRILKSTAESIFQSSWYPNKKVLLESVPHLSSQTYPVFRHMIECGLNEEYRFYWLVEDRDKYKDTEIENVYYVDMKPKTTLQKLHRMYLQMTCRLIMYSTQYVSKVFERQLQVYLIHGSPIKSRKKHSRPGEVNESDIVISLSDFLREMVLNDPEELHLKNNRLEITGYPRNDYLFSRVDIAERMNIGQFNKYIVWMPTFRITKGGARVDSNAWQPFGLPCLNSDQECHSLNTLLQSLDILLIVKPHPAQDMTAIADFQLSNISIITDDLILDCGLQPYEVLGSVDALITDYSSVYYDYLLTGNPIGLTTDDYEEYKLTTGFCYENIYEYLKGYKIANFEDLASFINSVGTGTDDYKDEREAVTALFHKYKDNGSSERVVQVIMDEIDKRYT